MLGREVGTPLSLLACSPPGVEASVPWADDLHRRFSDSHRLVVGATQASHRAVRSYTYRRQKGNRFEVGDQVWLYERKARKGATPKLDADRWSGPWEILKSISDSVYVIRRTAHSKPRVVNVNRLMPYAPRGNNQLPVNQVDDNTGETNEGDDHSEVAEVHERDLDASSINGGLALTSRALRTRPLWQDAFDLE